MTLDEVLAALHENAADNGWQYPDAIMAPKATVDGWFAQMDHHVRKKCKRGEPLLIHGVPVILRDFPTVALVRYGHRPAPPPRTRPPDSAPA